MNCDLADFHSNVFMHQSKPGALFRLITGLILLEFEAF